MYLFWRARGGHAKVFKITLKVKKNIHSFTLFIASSGPDCSLCQPVLVLCFTPLIQVNEENTYSTQCVSTQLQNVALYREKVE